MEKPIGTYVGIAYIAASVLLALVLSRVLHMGFFKLGLEDYPILGSDFTLSGAISAAVATAAGIVCFRHPYVRGLSDEVAMELAKVHWPTSQETWAATVVVIVTVAVSAMYLGIFDAVWLWASNALLSIPNGTSTHG